MPFFCSKHTNDFPSHLGIPTIISQTLHCLDPYCFLTLFPITLPLSYSLHSLQFLPQRPDINSSSWLCTCYSLYLNLFYQLCIVSMLTSQPSFSIRPSSATQLEIVIPIPTLSVPCFVFLQSNQHFSFQISSLHSTVLSIRNQ